MDLTISELGLSGRAFEKSCGLSNGSYSSIGDGVGADKLSKILFTFPQISADWLISGKGEMFRRGGDVATTYGSDTGVTASVAGVADMTGVVSRNGDGNGNGRGNGKVARNIARKSVNDGVDADLFRLTNMLTSHQANTVRLIAEIERNGERFDRMLSIIENRQAAE